MPRVTFRYYNSGECDVCSSPDVRLYRKDNGVVLERPSKCLTCIRDKYPDAVWDPIAARVIGTETVKA